MKLWLDDVRDPRGYGCIGWFWVKSYEEAVATLKFGDVEEASLDHDLGYADPKEPTGYDVVCWMEENNVWPKRVSVHSMSPFGAKRMMDVIGRHTEAIRRFL